MNNKYLQKYDLPGRLYLHTQPFFALSLVQRGLNPFDNCPLRIRKKECTVGREILFH